MSEGAEIFVQNTLHTIEVVNSASEVNVTDSGVVVVFDDSQAQVVTAGIQGPQGIPGPPTGPGTEIEKLEFVGLGTGSTKTTTIIVGDATLAEAFGIGDELYVQWILPSGVDRTVAPKMVGSFFPAGSEVGTTVSWQVDFLADAHGGYLDGATAVKYMTDVALPETQYEALHGELEFPNSGFLSVDTDAVHIRIKRIASSNDPAAKVAIEHLAVEYTTDGKIGEQGEQGPAGSGGANTITYTAGEALGGHRVVYMDTGIAYYADKDTVAHVGKIAGLTTGAAADAAAVTVQTAGEVEELSWTWVAGAVYLGSNGQLTQTPPTSGILQEIGTAITATKLLIRLQLPIIR